MTRANLTAVREDIAEIVSQSVVETFNNMFGQKVLPNAPSVHAAPDSMVLSCIKMIQGPTEVDFCFWFDLQLLLQAAQHIFTQEYMRSNPVLEDIACEIANIVCHKVKAYLNEDGYFTEVGFPFVPADKEALLKQAQLVHMHFFYQNKDDRQNVGVSVNLTLA